MKIKPLIILGLISGLLSTSCEHNKVNTVGGAEIEKAELQDEKSVSWEMDTVFHLINTAYKELGHLPLTSSESVYCEWLEEYKMILTNKVAQKHEIEKTGFVVVGYAKLSDDKYFVAHRDTCELVGSDEVPPKVINSINRIPGCAKPEENRFEPNEFKNSISKTHPNTIGVLSLIQIWYNNK